MLRESSFMTRASLQRRRSTRTYTTGEPTSTLMTTSYQISFDFSELVLFVNYVTIYECNMIFVCDMHAWIVDRHMNVCNISFYPFIRVSTDLYVFQIQITNEESFFILKNLN